MTSAIFPRRTVDELTRRRSEAMPPQALEIAGDIVGAVRREGESAVRRYAERFRELELCGKLYRGRDSLEAAWAESSDEERMRLGRTAARIRTFAEAQRRSLGDVSISVPGGEAGHTVTPVERAGCYAPGGRYPLVSSALMTAIAARAAGVPDVWLATPRPARLMLAAAHVAGVDGVLAVGGAHAIAALAFGIGPITARDVIVGPGNNYVTAAKQLVSGETAIDIVAGPSELVILADDSADAKPVAADLLAQAEHDPVALPVLVTTDQPLISKVRCALDDQLAGLPTAEVARAALMNGGFVAVEGPLEAVAACNRLAPEHLQLAVRDAEWWLPHLTGYGAIFMGHRSSAVFGDYGVGPNHVLPTGGTARSRAGLSVYTFMRAQTWFRADRAVDRQQLVEDTVWFARVEGLEAHARAAERRG
ncbi:MAG: histidinol dehydrogenase [Gemmatimonadales bacterium]